MARQELKIKRKQKINKGLGPLAFIIMIIGFGIGAIYVGSLLTEDFLEGVDTALGGQGKKPPPPLNSSIPQAIPPNFN